MSRKTRQQPRARAAVVELPRGPRTKPARLRYAPSGRSLLYGLAIAAFAALLYLGARETSVFAVRSIRVEGVPPKLAQQVEAALQPIEGVSLLKLNGMEVQRLATALPQVADVSYDRAFPNTLRVHVVAEQPLAVLRRAGDSWLVSRRGRVIEKLAQGALPSLPRIWVKAATNVTLGGMLPAGGGAEQAAALAPAREAGLERVSTVTIDNAGQIVYVLRGGLQVRVGTNDNLPLKLAIARTILASTTVGGYLDVSVPERPVALGDSQVSTRGRG
ncbi:MAG: cell division protein FtsQ/DivIB [Gaiellaceae bacterium]